MPSIYTIEHEGHQLEIEANSPDEALGAARTWKPSQAPMTAGEKASDAYKSFDAGVAGGTSALLGLPGNLTNWGAQGIGAASDWINEKLGLPKYQPPATPGPVTQALNKIPTGESMAAEIQRRNYGGAQPYQPKGELGEYAKSIGEAAPGAVAGPGGLLMKGAAAVGSGIGSEFFGDQYKGTAFEPWARMIGGVIGGGAAPIAGNKAVEAARNYGAARSAGREIGDILGTDAIKPGAVRRVAQSAADDALTPQSVQATRDRLGPEAMAMDLGRQMQGRAEAVALPLGKAQNTVLDAVEGRTGEYGSGARTRIEGTLDQHLGPSQNVVKLMDDVDEMVRRQATPAYERVMADYPAINVPPEITSRPAVAQAMKNAHSLAENYGEKLGTTETRTLLRGDGYHIADDVNLPAQTSLKYWDYVKKGLDTRINGFMRSGVDDLSSSEKADLGGLLNAKQALLNHLDGVTGGAYADARRIAATKPELHEALDFGRSIFNSKLLPEEMAQHIEGLSIPAQAMAQVGARRELARVLDSARNDGAKARAFLDTNNNRQKIANLFGERAAQAIENRVGAENTFQDATQTIARNSRTATRQQMIQDTETPSPARVDTTMTGLALKPLKAGYAYALQHGMQNTRNDVASVLTAKGDQLNPIVDALLSHNRAKAGNVSAVSPQIQAMIRALASGALSR